jgi:hypothetical protein
MFNISINLKDKMLSGKSYSLGFNFMPNEDRSKYLKTAIVFTNCFSIGGKYVHSCILEDKST